MDNIHTISQEGKKPPSDLHKSSNTLSDMEKDIIKDLIINDDTRLAEALVQFDSGNPIPLNELVKQEVLKEEIPASYDESDTDSTNTERFVDPYWQFEKKAAETEWAMNAKQNEVHNEAKRKEARRKYNRSYYQLITKFEREKMNKFKRKRVDNRKHYKFIGNTDDNTGHIYKNGFGQHMTVKVIISPYRPLSPHSDCKSSASD